MKIMYKASALFGGSIYKVEVVRETDKFIELSDGRKVKKTSDDFVYRDTFEEAKRYIIDKKQREVNIYKLRLEGAEKSLLSIKNIKE